MTNELEANVDQWYSHRGKGEMFRVVAVDDGAIEIQSFDGDLEELDREAWRNLDIEPAEPPENWTGPFDNIETDDLGDTENAMSQREWRAPVEPLRQEEKPWHDTRPLDEREEEDDRTLAELYAEEAEQRARDEAQ